MGAESVGVSPAMPATIVKQPFRFAPVLPRCRFISHMNNHLRTYHPPEIPEIWLVVVERDAKSMTPRANLLSFHH